MPMVVKKLGPCQESKITILGWTRVNRFGQHGGWDELFESRIWLRKPTGRIYKICVKL